MTQPKLISYDEMRSIPLELLVGDRELQRDIHYSLVRGPHSYIVGVSPPLGENPFAVPVLSDGHRTSWKHLTFRVNDPEKCAYFFETSWPREDLPPFLRKEDMLPSGVFTSGSGARGKGGSTMFTKGLQRVRSIEGELPERYNARTKRWESYGDGLPFERLKFPK